jgi:hypothetical protein
MRGSLQKGKEQVQSNDRAAARGIRSGAKDHDAQRKNSEDFRRAMSLSTVHECVFD